MVTVTGAGTASHAHTAGLAWCQAVSSQFCQHKTTTETDKLETPRLASSHGWPRVSLLYFCQLVDQFDVA